MAIRNGIIIEISVNELSAGQKSCFVGGNRWSEEKGKRLSSDRREEWLVLRWNLDLGTAKIERPNPSRKWGEKPEKNSLNNPLSSLISNSPSPTNLPCLPAFSLPFSLPLPLVVPFPEELDFALEVVLACVGVFVLVLAAAVVVLPFFLGVVGLGLVFFVGRTWIMDYLVIGGLGVGMTGGDEVVIAVAELLKVVVRSPSLS
jgi:hypothetical protein